jgi:hypothetical protein
MCVVVWFLVGFWLCVVQFLFCIFLTFVFAWWPLFLAR